MEGRCVFVFFIIFNSILGLSGLALFGTGIGLLVNDKNKGATGTITPQKVYIAMIVIGGYITLLLILGSCSWKKSCVLIFYFILSIPLMLSELAVIIFFKVFEKSIDIAGSGMTKETFELAVDISVITFGVSLGIAFMSFLFSTIYFCLMKSGSVSTPKLYSEVRNMENMAYMNMSSYQNV